ncbi:MAG: PH domain-containing protein [Deltaproteobacteria bacterium]|jgi:membrane protein YdbS with pleckstrin-like domain|nr:PH domain-containing protein [Deltaproteobacteria bacterium]
MKPSNFIATHLISDEEFLYECRKHWMSLLPAFLTALAALILLFNVSSLTSLIPEAAPERSLIVRSAGWAVRIVALFLLYRAAKDLLVFFSTELGFTDRRLIGKVGFLRIRSLLTPLDKINHISATNGILGRFLRFGNVLVHTSSGQITYEQIAGHLDFINALMEQIAVWHQESPPGQGRRHAAGAGGGSAGPDTAPVRARPATADSGPRIPRAGWGGAEDASPALRDAPPGGRAADGPEARDSLSHGAHAAPRSPEPGPDTAGDGRGSPKSLIAICPNCQTPYSYQPMHAGRSSRCRKCGAPITAPPLSAQA